ncbi:UNVERIFIED_CONTAM: hypothetical protein Slati_4263200 [Sesamum latifolium]|uniref:Uncharacterized protein n=1 Tax=Sesamum latifolium TaxID=2727402 RepID=A0AAW2TDV5_9LAMI
MSKKICSGYLAETGLLGSKPTNKSMEHGHKRALAEGEDADDPAYRQLVGRLIYLTITRPKISNSLHVLSQFAQAPRKEHFEAAFCVLRYIKSNLRQRI